MHSPRALALLGLFSLSLAAAPLARAAEPEQTDLFDAEDGRYKSYRIPCLLALPDDTVLAITSARKAVSDWADIDLLMRRSADGGKTWSEPVVLANADKDVADNPVAIWDDRKKVVHFLYQTNYEKIFHRTSSDGGKTFSEPVEITPQLGGFAKSYPWHVIAPGPGHGIQLKNGRLVVPVWLSPGEVKSVGKGREHRPSVVSTIYSDDHGQTWQAGEIVPDTIKNLNETVAVETPDGGVMLVLRNEDPSYAKAVSYSKDGATGWTEPELKPELYTPICFASVLRLPSTDGKERILFANPDSRNNPTRIRDWGARPRENLSLKLSYDGGKTWPVNKVLEPGRAGYSDLAVLSDGTILCLYERGFIKGNDLNTKLLTIARIPLEWITDGKDSLRQASR